MNKNFELELPEGYTQVKYLNAKDKKFGLIISFACIGITLAVLMLMLIPMFVSGAFKSFDWDSKEYNIAWIIVLLGYLVYMVLHEIVHGICYKCMTKQKLTFGLSWSCAFCGVPNIYTYRRVALISMLAPFVLFTLILLPLSIVLYFVSPYYYLAVAFLFALHLGGCIGDLYGAYLLIFKYRAKDTLIRDTGPEQYFYKKDNEK